MKLTEKKVVIFTMLWWLSCTTPVQVPDQTDPIERIDFEYIQARGEKDVSDSAYVAVLVKNPFNGVEVKEVKVDWSGENEDLSILYTKDLNDIGIDGDILVGDNLHGKRWSFNLNPDKTDSVYFKVSVLYKEEGNPVEKDTSFILGNIFPQFEEICIYEVLDIKNCEGPFTLTLPDTGLAKLIKVSAKVTDANGPEDIHWVGFTSKRLSDEMMLNQGNYIFMDDTGNTTTYSDTTKNDGIFSTLVKFPYNASKGELEWRFRVQDWSGGFNDVFDTVCVMPPSLVFGSGYPNIDNIATTSFDLKVQIDENGKAYYVVLSDGAEAPSSNEVKAGTGSGGETAIASGSITLFASTEASEPITGLSVKTPYDVYVVAEVTPNLQLCPTKVEVSTLQ